ncbi:MAG: sigma-54-dependent Fis family transcriptional regulator [Azonexus sp.]|nr:sigma-54-dependent Fis family transcriptional regulator [Betaproteobacteria bacterium]MBK8919675.1 sigma-54-dependent Fis family transcriptional regulator [Betaproteobacteria bacterium]MBP6034917.1 sigma-54-dependent Fis family transcriptional regulator [Azonexus sp.]MBP6905623.1 sigma-54-dependent Fis family transcriptional regulator [Azonexus sp.]
MAIILVVDDEVGIRELLSEILIDEGYDVRLAENAGAARRVREELRPDLVLLDIWMPDTDGISLLKEWHAGGQLSMPVVMMSGHGTIDSAVEATRFGAFDFLEKPIALQKLLTTVQKALKHAGPVQRPHLTLEAFARTSFMKEFKRRLEQAAGKASVILLKGASGGMAEICARTLQPPRAPWLDLSSLTAAVSQEALEKAGGGVIFVPDLSALGKLQQMNLSFTLDRLEKLNLLLVAASSRPLSALGEAGWDGKLIARLGEIWVAMPSLAGHADDVPEIAGLLLTHFIERGEVPARRLASSALNALRTQPWKGAGDGGWSELYTLVRNLALTTLDDEIVSDDVARLRPQEEADATVASLLPLLDQPLREARDAFEKIYFEHHLRLEGGNMTKLADKSGLERTHLYRKLKQLGVALGRRAED